MRAGPRRELGRAQGASRRRAAHHRRLVGQADGHSGRGPRAGGRRGGLPAPDQRRRAPRAPRDRRRGGGRRRRHGRLPRGQAAQGLQERQGDLPPRPGRDPGPPRRTRRSDQGRDRVRLSHPADRRGRERRRPRPALSQHQPRRARRRRPPPPGGGRRQRARHPLWHDHRRRRPDRGERGARPLGPDGRRPGARRFRFHGHHRGQGLRRRRRRLRRLHHRHRHVSRPPRGLLPQGLPRGRGRPGALSHPLSHAPRGGGRGRGVGALPAPGAGLPRRWRRPALVPRDRIDLRPQGGQGRGRALLPLRRRDRLGRLLGAPP